MFNLIVFIKTAGYLGIAGVVFAESGLLIGFFLPGDSLLFTAGILASQHYLNIFLLVALAFVSAVIGDSVGYSIGRRTGPLVFNKPESFWFRPDHLERAHNFFDKHGPKALVFARFLPIVRTFVPVIAGVGKMKYRTFLTYNIIGGALWTVGVSLAGFYLGKLVPNIDSYLLPIIVLIIVVSFLPTLIHVWRDEGQRKYVISAIKKVFKKKAIK